MFVDIAGILHQAIFLVHFAQHVLIERDISPLLQLRQISWAIVLIWFCNALFLLLTQIILGVPVEFRLDPELFRCVYAGVWNRQEFLFFFFKILSLLLTIHYIIDVCNPIGSPCFQFFKKRSTHWVRIDVTFDCSPSTTISVTCTTCAV